MRQLEAPLQEGAAATSIANYSGHDHACALVVVASQHEEHACAQGGHDADIPIKSSKPRAVVLQGGQPGPKAKLPDRSPANSIPARPGSPTHIPAPELLLSHLVQAEPTWRTMAGTGTCFVRTVAGSLSGHVEAALDDPAIRPGFIDATGGSTILFQDTPWVAAGCIPSEQRKHAARLCNIQMTTSFRCCNSQGCTDKRRASPSAMHVMLSWQDGGTSAKPSYAALQADFRTQTWSLQRIQLTPDASDATVMHASVQELAQARDSGLMEGVYCSLELCIRQGGFLTLRRPDTAVCVFSHLPLSSLLACRSPAEPKPSVRRRFCDLQPQAPIFTPVGLGVRGCRLEFKHWEVTAAPVSHSAQTVVGTGPGDAGSDASLSRPASRDRASGSASSVPSSSGEMMLGDGDAMRLTDMPAGLQAALARKSSKAAAGTSGSPAAPGSPAAAAQAFPGLSAAASTAVAVSATAAANNRWSRKPYINEADPHLVEVIMSDIIRPSDLNTITFDDIASLTRPKQLLHEAVVLPLVLPELFTGIREPWKGVLLFGPPGTGKTMLARAVASVSGITFFSASSASLTSKWRGDSEKLVRTLFAAAAHYAPSIIFVDEIDALASSRDMDGEGDASRRFKAELLQQMDGLVSSQHAAARSRPQHGTMVLAASNCPWDLDPALRRRLEKRLHIKLPDEAARLQLFQLHLRGVSLSQDVDLQVLAQQTDGYSGADVKNICRDAAMAPMRRMVSGRSIEQLKALRFSMTSSMDPVSKATHAHASKGQGTIANMVSSRLVVEQADLLNALANTKPSVGPSQLKRYEQWEAEFSVT